MTIPIEELDAAHAEALTLRAKLSALHNEHPGPTYLDDCVSAGLASRLVNGHGSTDWFITDAGLRVLGIQAEPPATYSVSWKYDGATREAHDGLTLENARREIEWAVGQLRACQQVTAIAVVDEATREDVTAEVGRGLIPHPGELRQLEHRAAFIAGLAELRDYLIAHPSVPVPQYASILCSVGGETDDRQRDAVYVAAAALAVDVKTRQGRVSAERKFGPIRYDVYSTPEQMLSDWDRQQQLGRAALATEKAAQTEDGDR